METAGAAAGHGSHRFADAQDPPRELSGLAWGVFVTLGLVALLGLARILVDLALYSAASDEGDVGSAYDTYSNLAGIHGLLFLVSAGVFIAWFFRAYKNVRRLGVQNMRYGNGWAIGSWFIPIFNWFRPKQMANDIWRGSERGVEVSTQWRQVPVPSLVHWWWGLFLLQGLLIQVGQAVTESGYNELFEFGGSISAGLSRIETGTVIDILGAITTIAAAVLAIMVVSRITQRLDELRRGVLAQGPTEAPAPSTFPPPAAAPPPPPPPEQRIQCPECAEWIQAQANVCRFCGHRLRPTVQ